MKRAVSGIGIVILIALAFLAGSSFQKGRGAGSDAGRKVLYYVDPMHPAYKSDRPGIAPDCGMKLEPVYADGGPAAPAASGDLTSLPPGTVEVSPEKRQVVGVKLGVAEKKPWTETIRLLGKVTADELKIYRINTASDGWVLSTYPVTVGSIVKKGQPLATFYGSELLPAQQGLITAVNAMERYIQSGLDIPNNRDTIESNIQMYSDNLRRLGIGDEEIEQIKRTKMFVQKLPLRAPESGMIIERGIYSGQRFEKGTDLFKIVDLSRVWVLADVFENEAAFLRPGTRAKVIYPPERRIFQAVVSAVPPLFDATTRTLKVRLEMENPGLMLRPEMFVDVELPVSLPSAITIPVDAVVDTGMRKTVYVDRGNGLFEPRRIETGRRLGSRVEVKRGLMAGEKVVVSGTFLIDSESRMKAAASGIFGASARDPVCGMYVDEAKARAAGMTRDSGRETHYFCSPECRQEFDKDPKKHREAAGAEKRTGQTMPGDLPPAPGPGHDKPSH